MKKSILLLAAIAIVSTVACSKGSRRSETLDKKATPGEGTGGRFVDTDSGPILQKVATELANEVRTLPTSALKELGVPSEWTARRIAKVIEDVELKPDVQRQRNGRSLMMDNYRDREKIAALSPFFLIYSHIGKQFDVDLQAIGMRASLLWETSHLWDTSKTDEEADMNAEGFAKSAVDALHRHIALCEFRVAGAPRRLVIDIAKNIVYHTDQALVSKESIRDRANGLKRKELILGEGNLEEKYDSVDSLSFSFLMRNKFEIWSHKLQVSMSKSGLPGASLAYMNDGTPMGRAELGTCKFAFEQDLTIY